MKRTDRQSQRRRVAAFAHLTERGCVADQPQQLRIIHDVEKAQAALLCETAAAGALTPSHSRAPAKSGRVAAFTLIELLVVIAIIGILAGLIFPVVGMVNRNKQLSLAKAQLQQIQQAIEAYHTKLGYYPPDDPNNVVSNQLYFELMGTTNDAANSPGNTAKNYATADGSAVAKTSDLVQYFNVQGVANTSTRTHSDDSGSAASSFLTHLLPNQIAQLDSANAPQVLILVCPIAWPGDKTPAPIFGTTLNPWRYTSSHPTNNTGSYDLWVDLVIRGKTNRVSNWSGNPIVL